MRVNLSIPDELVAQIDERCRELCVNRSAYICMSMKRQMEQEKALQSLPDMLATMQRAVDESVANRLHQGSKQG